MAKPMTSSQFLAQLTKWKIPYTPFRTNWSTHNRGNRGNGFSDVNGVMQHHTGSASQTIQNFLYSGDSSLPGPLCHVGNDNNGRLWLIGWGRTNHAGSGDVAVLNRVIPENYTGTLKPRPANAGGETVDGNGRFYGIENMYTGSTPMSRAQYRTAVLFSAAILDFHKWKAESVIAHGEWTPRKWDPGIAPSKMMDMVKFRNDVRDALKKGPTWGEPPKTTPPPSTPVASTHKIVSGDTLWSLSEKYLGAGNRWLEFVKENPSLVNLQLNTTIKVPKK
jgi:hypothetical protein